MQKLCSVVGAILVASTAIGASVTYEGTLGDGTTPFSEFFADTKGSASSKTPWVHPSNVVNLASKEAARLIKLQQSNGAVDSSDLPYGGIWPTGYTVKDYVDYVWKASILTLGEKEDALYAKIGPFLNVSTNVSGVKKGNIAIGEGANVATDAYGLPCGIVAINPYGAYPSYAYGSFNTVIGIDSMVGYGDDGVGGVLKGGVLKPNEARYATSVGVSNKAQYMHSYAFGSQLNSLSPNSTTLGYGLTALHNRSVVIGHGVRPGPDFYFDREISESDASSQATISANAAGVVIDFEAWCRTPSTTAANADKRVVDNIISIRVVYTPSGGTKKTLTETLVGITAVLDSPDSNGRYVQYELDPPDWKRGRHNADYGISHGDGTVNFVVPSFLDNPLCGVYVNDRNLADLTGNHLGETRVVTNFVNGAAVVKTQLDYSVSIGQNSSANGSSGTHLQNVAIGRDSDAPGQAAVALGPNSFAYGEFGIALGWRANAVGNRSIAIGAAQKSGQNYFLPDTMNGTVNPNSDLALASGDNAIAVGFNAKATDTSTGAIGYKAKADANGAFQIGTGTNSTPNSLQFMGVKIVENGRLLGGNADPKEAVIPAEDITTTGAELSIKLNPGSVYTILPEANCGPGTEISVEAPVDGLRNYEVYFPNEPEVCAGLPVCVNLDEIPSNIKKVIVNNVWQAHKLPAKVTVKQPYGRLVICEITEFDDGTDWSPIITGSNLYWTNGMFRTEGSRMLIGTNLHSGVSMKLVYPISASANCTNDLMEVNSDGIFDGTFYNYTMSLEYSPKPGENVHGLDGEGNTWFEIIYETKCGQRPAVFRKQFNLLGL